MDSHHESIADGLAGQGYAVLDHFLSAEEIDDILGLGIFDETSESFRKAGVGKSQHKHINESIRGDYIHWLDKNSAAPPLKRYLDKLAALSGSLNRSLFLSIKDHEVHLTIYPAGTFYKRHLDQFKKDDHRILSVICYLNRDWKETDGGQLRMYLPDHSVDVFPNAGRLVCFRSDLIEHEVLPANRERLSLTGWLVDQYIDIIV